MEGTKVLYVVMPAYNEEKSIEEVVKQWYPVLEGKSEGSRLIIADSCSTDRTHEILLGLKKIYPQLEILSDTGKQHGPKLMALYGYAIAKGADYIFQTDSDGQTDPKEFDAFWQLKTEYDAIFGYRNVREDGVSRAFVERVVCFLLKVYFGVKVPDANAPFRLMKADIVKKYLCKMPKDYELPNIMLTTFCSYYQERIVFKTVSFKPRIGGENSIDIIKIIKIGWKALGDFRTFKKKL